jgi:4-hydroxybenzoate polyprenyltransferase
VDRRLLTAWRPYTRLARLDRPLGIWLTLFPTSRADVQLVTKRSATGPKG